MIRSLDGPQQTEYKYILLSTSLRLSNIIYYSLPTLRGVGRKGMIYCGSRSLLNSYLI